ncbi:MAG: 30S ribosomal protein S12 methylthiotransferase RimO [Clostridium sp.]|nr:30S ribosomal protein S12 methylthiotransferase RimO [Clostridium sp.]MCM1207623.1 30S ribosomal protein S12 methylthiotransferase RimO [Ruminococcus sp.]
MNVLMVSLGCDKNLCDSEAMLGLLMAEGYNITNEESEADVVIINTCSFIHDAMEESINTILEMARLKENRLKYLVVTGCLAQRFREEITKEIPEIDACLGIGSIDGIVDVIRELEETDCSKKREHDAAKNTDQEKEITKQFIQKYDDINRLPLIDTDKVITSGTFMGYLKIAEGCNKHCTYCVIPKIRGSFRSVPKERLIKEASYMAEQGIKELVLVAQECTSYGVDLYGKKVLHELIHALGLIDGIEWIRVLYCYPEEITEELIDAFANEPKLLHYIDMPLQHSEDNILARMGRKTDKASIQTVIARLRSKIPDMAIRTTFITGFPGETQEEHEALLAFIDEIEFDRLGVFTYSREEGTPAAGFENQVDEETALLWKNEIMELQQEISLDKHIEFVGKIMKVIVEGYIPEEDVYVGRTYRDAAGIDGFVYIHCGYELISGDIVDVRITEAAPYDLIGEIKDEFTE